MPFIIATSSYPSHKQDEVVKKYIKLIPKYPPDESLGELIAQPVSTGPNGITVLSIYRVKEGKLDAAFIRTGTQLYEYKDIEGYEYEVKVWLTFPEAAAIAGIPSPE
ncbi:hypothetical protein LCGC14_1290840 [marine sediment metagenome]|uniref:Uncharacterized protein n=1 Tax=marine sediment metagenome TaxID=412755 RepID=A0A0F9KSN2_9ZZZZ|nr:hypothetical protein [bacterium]